MAVDWPPQRVRPAIGWKAMRPATAGEITELNEAWLAGYKRQIEIYQ
jgi:hypothetical protein